VKEMETDATSFYLKKDAKITNPVEQTPPTRISVGRKRKK